MEMISSKENDRGAVNRPTSPTLTLTQLSLSDSGTNPRHPLPPLPTSPANMGVLEPTSSSTAVSRPPPIVPASGERYDELDEGWEQGLGLGLASGETRREGLPTYEQSIGHIPVDDDDDAEDNFELDDRDGGVEQEETGHGSTSRFGRWRGWVEKRAHERYADDTGGREERRAARRLLVTQPRPPSYDFSSRPNSINGTTSTSTFTASTSTATTQLPSQNNPNNHTTNRQSAYLRTPLEGGDGLCRLDFGSRFIPHSRTRITSCLPILNGRLVIIGTTDGLRVLNTSGKEDVSRPLWSGLGVWEMKILSSSNSNEERTPSGSIALLCGEDTSSSSSSSKSGPKRGEVRVYILQSLVSLARYASTQNRSSKGIEMIPDDNKGNHKGKNKKKENQKEKKEWIIDDPRSSLSVSSEEATATATDLDQLAQAWAKDYFVLPTHPPSSSAPSGNAATATNMTTYTYITTTDRGGGVGGGGGRVYVAIGTPTHIIIHVALTNDTHKTEFRGWKVLSLPSTPGHMSFVRLATATSTSSSATPTPGQTDRSNSIRITRTGAWGPASNAAQRPLLARGRGSTSTSVLEYDDYSETHGVPPPPAIAPPAASQQTEGEPSLGIHVSFGSKAALIRISDSAVLDFRLMNDIRGDWGPINILKLGQCQEQEQGQGRGMSSDSGEVYVLTKGKETCLFSAPILIPSQNNTYLTRILWPEIPLSITASLTFSSSSSSGEGEEGGITIRLSATSHTGNLHIRNLPFTAGSGNGGGPVGNGNERAATRLFVSIKIGQSPRILTTTDWDKPGQGQGIYVGYKMKDKDWRMIKLEQ